MENKKLLKFLLRDLSELEELITEKEDNSFDELEMEFLQTRVSSAKRMIQILFNNENSPANENADKQKVIVTETIDEKTVVQKEITEKPVEKSIIVEDKTESEIEENFEESEKEVREEVEDALDRITEEVDEVEKEEEIELKEEQETAHEIVEDNKVELEEKKVIVEANQRLGDSFSKEKSVNDLVDSKNSKLEDKISNRPVKSIKTAIGINDKFQFIRELFDGNAEVFTNTVFALDAKKDINEAVKYLQQNFKWKKNETSLKFVNLVKRRFSNE